MHDRPLPETTLELNTPMAAPHWALLERQLMAALPEAIEEFYAKYFDERGYLLCYPRWGALDGPDDAAENVTGWTELYALGGPERVLKLYRQGIEGHMRQYTEARTVECPLARDGMYYKEFPTSFDFVHNAEGFHGLFQQGLAEPWDPTYQARMRRYAGFYMDEDPGAANYDPKHRLIRSVMTGSRGPVLRRTTPVDWGGDPFECEGRFTPLRWHRTWQDYVDHFSIYQDVTGDTPCNLAVTVMALNAYLCTGEAKYRDWILEYADAWVERADENGGIMPSNVGLDGTIGGGTGGRWWGAVYGWDHKAYFRCLAPYGFGNALLVSGDQRYVDVWRRNIQAVSAHAKEVDGTLQYPQKHGDDGWYEFSPEPYDHGALEIFYWSMDERDRALARRSPWGAYLSGDDPDYPVAALSGELAALRETVQRMRDDTTTPDTRLSESMNSMNPGACIWRLVELMLGGLPSRHIGVAWHTRVRYFDLDRGRPGIPDDVASLVDSMSDDEVTVKLVNLSPVRRHALVLQAGAYAEHQLTQVEVDGSATSLDESAVTVHLAPGAGARLTLKMKRYANQPTHAFPGIGRPFSRTAAG